MFDGPQGHWQHQQQRGPPQGHHQMPQRGNGMMGMGNENHFEAPPQHPEEFQGHGHAHGQGYGLGHGQGHGHGHGRQQSFEESATLKCTGIPRYVKEAELYSHFAKFGKIVKMDLKRFGADDPSGMDQKTYNECLVQFEDASDCRKCLSSPLSVLNNRFIKIFSAPHNIVAPGEVDGIDEVYPGAKADEEEGLWAAVERGGPGGRGRGGRMGGRGRGRWNFGGRDFGGRAEFGGGRGDFGAEESSRRRADSSGQDQQQSVSGDSGELIVSVPNGERGSEKNSRGGGEEGNEDHPITPTAAQLEKERLRGMVQQKYDDLKSLRHRAEGIWRQKEDLLQVRFQLLLCSPLCSVARGVGSDRSVPQHEEQVAAAAGLRQQ
jgi:RNA recognition motif-containing protein